MEIISWFPFFYCIFSVLNNLYKMDKAVELYPEKENIDKAYYYFIEERGKLYDRRKTI